MTRKCLEEKTGHQTYPQRTFDLVILDNLGGGVSFEHHLSVKEERERESTAVQSR